MNPKKKLNIQGAERVVRYLIGTPSGYRLTARDREALTIVLDERVQGRQDEADQIHWERLTERPTR